MVAWELIFSVSSSQSASLYSQYPVEIWCALYPSISLSVVFIHSHSWRLYEVTVYKVYTVYTTGELRNILGLLYPLHSAARNLATFGWDLHWLHLYQAFDCIVLFTPSFHSSLLAGLRLFMGPLWALAGHSGPLVPYCPVPVLRPHVLKGNSC